MNENIIAVIVVGVMMMCLLLCGGKEGCEYGKGVEGGNDLIA